jgi:aryl-alcohol dehydrogenase-like predicted oxidoreductase
MGPGPNDRGLSRKHILAAIDASLRRLGVDFVDLNEIHRVGPHTPIVGASKLEHLDQAVAALDLSLTDDERRRLEEPYVPHTVLGHQ